LSEGHTRRIERGEVDGGVFLAAHRALLVVVEGRSVGAEHVLEAPSCTIGRGPGVDITLQDDAMSRTHAAFEVGREGYRIRDMGSTNGLVVNGHPVTAADLKHGDRIQLGEHTLSYLVERRERVGTYDLSGDL